MAFLVAHEMLRVQARRGHLIRVSRDELKTSKSKQKKRQLCAAASQSVYMLHREMHRRRRHIGFSGRPTLRYTMQFG